MITVNMQYIQHALICNKITGGLTHMSHATLGLIKYILLCNHNKCK